jgi:hypothetical protein
MHAASVFALATSLFAVVTQATFYSALSPCPDFCAGKPENWTVYSSLDQLRLCKKPVLLDFAIYTPLDDPNITIKLRTCTIKGEGGNSTSIVTGPSKKLRRDSALGFNDTQTGISSNSLGSTKSSGNVSYTDIQTLLTSIQQFLAPESKNDEGIIFGHSPSLDIAVYAGADIDTTSALQKLADQVSKTGVAGTTLFELCGGNRTARTTFGATINTSDDLAAVQKSVAAWNHGLCAAGDMSITQPATIVNMTLAQHNISSPTYR